MTNDNDTTAMSDTDSSLKKPKAVPTVMLALRELVLELAHHQLADDFGPADYARLLAKAATVTRIGYPNKWSKAIESDTARANDRETHLPVSEAVEGGRHG